jgi:hypothetical protein
MHDGLRSAVGEDLLNERPIPQIALDERSCLWYSGPVPLREIVQDGDLVSGLYQFLDDSTPDVSGPTCDEDVHGIWASRADGLSRRKEPYAKGEGWETLAMRRSWNRSGGPSPLSARFPSCRLGSHRSPQRRTASA